VIEIPCCFGSDPHFSCRECGRPLTRYFGRQAEMMINYGERELHDEITKYQFRNL